MGLSSVTNKKKLTILFIYFCFFIFSIWHFLKFEDKQESDKAPFIEIGDLLL